MKVFVRSPFSTIFFICSLICMSLPFLSTFSSFLTNIFLQWPFYRMVESFIIPYQAKILASFLSLFSIKASATSQGVYLQGAFLELQWNCLGWQSAILLLATFVSGFRGKFTWVSRIEVVIIGFLGTYLMNIFRLASIGLVARFGGPYAAFFFHEYLTLALIILWFLFFWWFSYSFVLEER